jgi:hypothetical protein
MRIRRLPWLSLFLLVALAPNLPAADYNCPVTTPQNPPFVPPAPYEPNASEGRFWYGTNALWTQLPADGVERALPYDKDEGYSNKLPLWEQGNNGTKEPRPDIIVVVKRLDAKASLVSSRGGSNVFADGAWTLLTGVTYATTGCFEVTAAHDGHMLTFILSIQP